MVLEKEFRVESELRSASVEHVCTPCVHKETTPRLCVRGGLCYDWTHLYYDPAY